MEHVYNGIMPLMENFHATGENKNSIMGSVSSKTDTYLKRLYFLAPCDSVLAGLAVLW